MSPAARQSAGDDRPVPGRRGGARLRGLAAAGMTALGDEIIAIIDTIVSLRRTAISSRQCRRAQIERLDSSHQYSSFDRYPTAANTVRECRTDLLDWVRGGIMGERKPWWPKLKSLPFFTSSAEWEAQLSADDRIEVQDDEEEKKEENAVGVSADPAIKKSDKQ